MSMDSVEATFRSLDAFVERQASWLDPLADTLQAQMGHLLEAGGNGARQAKTFLNGSWLGHPLHPALTDVPIGAWTTALLFDLLGLRRSADAAIVTGIAAAVPTAVAGLADWHDTFGDVRRVGVAHALFNSVALGLYVGSALARRSGRRGLGMGLSTLGMAVATCGAYLGGKLVYARGTNVDRNAWSPEASDWQVAAREADLPEGQLARGEITVEGTKLPILLLKRGGAVLAIGATCSHMGGPLNEGKLLDEEYVECPWHGSQFCLRDGSVRLGPAAYRQPLYEVRLRDGNVEVRLARLGVTTGERGASAAGAGRPSVAA